MVSIPHGGAFPDELMKQFAPSADRPSAPRVRLSVPGITGSRAFVIGPPTNRRCSNRLRQNNAHDSGGRNDRFEHSRCVHLLCSIRGTRYLVFRCEAVAIISQSPHAISSMESIPNSLRLWAIRLLTTADHRSNWIQFITTHRLRMMNFT
jgi:hypothetical protein